MKKILIVTACDFPPVVDGVALIMRKLFRYFPIGSYCVVMGELEKTRMPIDHSLEMNCNYYFSPTPPLRGKISRKPYSYIYEVILIPLITMKIIKVIIKGKVDIILTVPHASFEIAAFLAHKILRKPLFVYLFDIYYAEGRLDILRRNFNKLFEKILLQSSSNTFVMSEPLEKHYLDKYGIKTEVIPHPVELSLYNGKTLANIASKKNGHFDIVYTGALYQAQLDAILNLIKAINSLSNIKLYLYLLGYTSAPGSLQTLKDLGIYGKNIKCQHAKYEDIPSVQKNADILFLPLSFNSPYPDVIKTASPGKMAEYLASGRPILVHAPEYSYIAKYAKREGWGLVIDGPNHNKLKEGLLSLLTDRELQNRLIENAQKTVKKHDARKVSAYLQEFFL